MYLLNAFPVGSRFRFLGVEMVVTEVRPKEEPFLYTDKEGERCLYSGTPYFRCNYVDNDGAIREHVFSVDDFEALKEREQMNQRVKAYIISIAAVAILWAIVIGVKVVIDWLEGVP